MLEIVVKGGEMFNERTFEFYQTKDFTIKLEHSLVSIAKWEAKYHKPFFSKEKMEPSEYMDYIKCMTITQNVPEEVYQRLSNKNIKDILNYQQDSMTAMKQTSKSKGGYAVITAETIYYWMISLNIPHEYEKWHINRLLALVEYVSLKNAPPEKMSQREMMEMYRTENEKRRAKYKSKG